METLVEEILSFISGRADSNVSALPVSYSFGAGMMATVNPCGFALLPAYISLFLGGSEEAELETQPVPRLLRAVLLSLVVTSGFVLLFGSVGLVIAAGGNFLTDAMDWAGLIIGVALTLFGLWLLLTHNNMYSGLAARLANKVDPGRSGSMRSFFMFGIAYGVASLSCALPIFLLVVVSSLVAGEFVNGLVQFISYALGMGAVIMFLTIGTALFKGVAAGYMRKLIPWVERASPVMVVLAGVFIVYYWLTIGELGEEIQAIF